MIALHRLTTTAQPLLRSVPFLFLLLGFRAAANPTIYSLSEVDSTLVRYDANTLHPLGNAAGSTALFHADAAWDIRTGRLFGIGAGTLIEFDALTGNVLHSQSYTGSISGLAARNGALYAMTGDNVLVKYDADTLLPKSAAALSNTYSHYDLAFDEASGRLFGIGLGSPGFGALVEFDPNDGSILNQQQYTGSIAGLAAYNGTLYTRTGLGTTLLQFNANSLLLTGGAASTTVDATFDVTMDATGRLFGTGDTLLEYDPATGTILNSQAKSGSSNGLAAGDPLAPLSLSLVGRAQHWYGNGPLGNFTLVVGNDASATLHDTRIGQNGTDGRQVAITTVGNGSLTFRDQSSAGAMTITNDGVGAGTYFLDSSSAAVATISSTNGALVRFDGAGVSAADATLWAKSGGRIEFRNGASGGRAHLLIDTGGRLDLSATPSGTFAVGSIAGAGTINLAGNAFTVGGTGESTLFSGTISGGTGGSLIKIGAGTLTIAGSSPVPFDVQAGFVALRGGTIGNTQVRAGSSLFGNGTVAGSLHNAGRIGPGLSTGKISVQGNFSQAASGQLVLGIASASQLDQLEVQGTASLAGTLTVLALNGFKWPTAQTVTLLTASAIQGTFSQIVSTVPVTESAALHFQFTYTATKLTAELEQIPFASFVVTPNEKEVANAAQHHQALSAKLNTIQSATVLAQSLRSLSPQLFEILPELTFNANALLQDRLVLDQEANGVRFEVNHRDGTIQGSVDRSDADFRSQGILLQGNLSGKGPWAAGAFLRYDETDADAGHSGTIAVESYGVGALVAHQAGPLGVRAAAGYSRHDYESRRIVLLDGFFPATASPRGSDWFGDLQIDWSHRRGAWTLRPFAGLTTTWWESESFVESGADSANITMPEQTATSALTRAGASVSYAWQGRHLRGEFGLHGAWLHEWSDQERHLHGAFGSASFALQPTQLAPDSALVGADYSIELRPGANLYAAVTLRTGDIETKPEWHVGMSFGF